MARLDGGHVHTSGLCQAQQVQARPVQALATSNILGSGCSASHGKARLQSRSVSRPGLAPC